jgi:ABC-type glycerol-3-phosphate transport system permease component
LSNFTSGQNNNIESDAMFRILISFVLTVFLFLGIIGTAKYMFSSVKANDQIVLAQVSEKVDSRLSIKEIEFITSSDNYRFTSVNDALR